MNTSQLDLDTSQQRARSHPFSVLQRSLSFSETWSFGVTSHISWISTAPAIHATLGASAFWVWIPIVLVGMLLNLQVQSLGKLWPNMAGGTPNYITQLLKNRPALARYAAISYFFAWAGYLPVNAMILTDLIKAPLDHAGLIFPKAVLQIGFTLLTFIVAFSGTRALSILHLIFAVLAISLLLLFSFQGFGWLLFAADSPGIWPESFSQMRNGQSLSFVDWAKWYFIAVYSVCGCETVASYVADSKKPNLTVKFLSISSALMPPIFWLGSWVLMRLATQPDLADSPYANLLAVSSRFWGSSASLVITFFIASSCLLGCATVVSNCPRILYQLAVDGYIAPVFGVVSRRGVPGPALVLTLVTSLSCLIWGDVLKIVMVTVTSYFTVIMLFHLGLWLQRRQPGVRWPRLALGIFFMELVTLIVGGWAWGWQDWLLGLMLPIGLLVIERLLQKIPFAPLNPRWWTRLYRPNSIQKTQDFLAVQVVVLVLLVCSAVTLGWLIRERLNTPSNDLLVVLILVVASVSVAVACWTSLPQVISIAEARQQAEVLFQVASDAILVIDQEGTIRQANPVAELLFDRGVEQLVGFSFYDLIMGFSDSPSNWVSRSEQRLLHNQNKVVEVSLSQQYSQDFQEYVVILRDVTERKQAEAALRASEEQFRTLVANIPGIVYRCRPNKKWTMTFISDAIEALVGYSPSDFTGDQGRSFMSIIHEDDRTTVETTVRLHLTLQQPFVAEFRMVCKDGSIRWVYEKGQGIFDSDNNLLWLDGAIIDITERKQAEDKLRQTLQLTEDLAEKATSQAQQLEVALQDLQQTQAQLVQNEKMSSLGQLVAGIAHEINNPVNFIHGNLIPAENYANGLLDLLYLYATEYPAPNNAISKKIKEIDLAFVQEDLPKLLNSMQMGTERIREIVQSLRIFSRLDEAEVKGVNVHDGIDSTLLILRNRLKVQFDRPEIKITQDYGSLPEIECYAGQLNQVFMNIISNAIDALEEKFATSNQDFVPSIHIHTSLVDLGWVRITFEDNGPGMPESVQKRILDPFFTTKAVGKGTGMGMSISYKIITETHGGKISWQSTIGEGTQFIIEIPVKLSTAQT
jgi:PAS domain S-box-containing protein